MENSQKTTEDELSENERKGKMAEKSFATLLDTLNIPFYYIDQRKETFSKAFHDDHIKRPDYIIFTDKGIFHIDVKYRTKFSFSLKDEKRFYLAQEDIEKLFNFYNKLHADTWIAFTNDENSLKFFYAPIYKIYDYSIFITNKIKERRSMESDSKTSSRIYSNEFCPIYIPETILYNHLSPERGFYKEPDWDFSEIDVEYHIDKANTFMENFDKEYSQGHCIECNNIIPFNKDLPLCKFHHEDKDYSVFYDYCHKCGSDIEPVEYARPLCKPCWDKFKNILWGAR